MFVSIYCLYLDIYGPILLCARAIEIKVEWISYLFAFSALALLYESVSSRYMLGTI